MTNHLYSIQILETNKNEFKANINKNNPSLQTVPTQANFGLQIILEIYNKLKKGETWGMPLDNKIAKKIVAEHPRKDELDRLSAILHGESKVLDANSFQKFKKNYQKTDKAIYQGRSVSGYVERGKEGILEIRPAPSIFIKEAKAVIPKVKPAISKNGNYGIGLTFKVKDEKLIDHLQAKMKWNSSIQDLRSLVSNYDNNRMHRV